MSERLDEPQYFEAYNHCTGLHYEPYEPWRWEQDHVPPQSQLSEHEIQKILVKLGSTLDLTVIMPLVREIEQAHGITE